MKFIAKHLNLIGVFLLASFGVAAAGLYFDAPQMLRSKPVKAATIAAEQPNKSAGCCANKSKPEAPPAPASCPHLAAQADSGCGSGCSHH